MFPKEMALRGYKRLGLRTNNVGIPEPHNYRASLSKIRRVRGEKESRGGILAESSVIT
jgi:hypothetical protein